MNQHGIVHPHMLARLQANFYPSRGTVQALGGTQDAYGQPVEDWADVAGLQDIPCRVAPVTRSNAERRTSEQVYVEATHHIALGGYYPAIRETMRFVVDGQAHDIQLVEHDGNGKTTRLLTRIVRSPAGGLPP